MNGPQMKQVCILILLFIFPVYGDAKPPSKAVIISCLAAQAISINVKWHSLSTHKIYAEDDYKDGFDATYYIKSHGNNIGYAERGEMKAILYGIHLFPISEALVIFGTIRPPAEIDPFSADWATVTDRNGSYLCISFPHGDVGQSGSFQTNRSAYLVATASKGRRILYSASGNIEVLLTGYREHK